LVGLFQKESLLLSVLKLKNNFKNLKLILNIKQTARNYGAILLLPNPFFENGGLLTNSSVSKL
jgi:hypothetical protein